mgnify:CR=1 FL=1
MIKVGQLVNHSDKLYKVKRSVLRNHIDNEFEGKDQQKALKTLQGIWMCDWTLQTQNQYLFCQIIEQPEIITDGSDEQFQVPENQ